jgi:hypothetical protein
MIRRWMIRSFALLMLIACTGLWFHSYFAGLFYNVTKGEFRSCGGCTSGHFCLTYYHCWANEPGTTTTEWDFGSCDRAADPYKGFADLAREFARNPDAHLETSIHEYFGFNWMMMTGPYHDRIVRAATAPCWFVETAVLAITLYVWRKTRPKVNPANSFPVVPGKVTPP